MNFGVCDFSRFAVTDWRLRRWHLCFLALVTATRKSTKKCSRHSQSTSLKPSSHVSLSLKYSLRRNGNSIIALEKKPGHYKTLTQNSLLIKNIYFKLPRQRKRGHFLKSKRTRAPLLWHHSKTADRERWLCGTAIKRRETIRCESPVKVSHHAMSTVLGVGAATDSPSF